MRAPAADRAARLDKVVREIDGRARPLMTREKITLSSARAKILSEDQDLAARYRSAVLDLPEPTEE